ncbi:fascin domain-containing protein, partial [Actinospica sp.]|uniref:fascin domain-containing protein n=1 Tax=Actinospica sp. TaxID=1872142 RepID=UPI002C15D833|nr:hypothetical protein [Actinospica sp.]
YKPNTDSNDWTFDAVDAARLDMSSQVSSDLVTETENYQKYIDGLAAFNTSNSDEPYIEQSSSVATALDEAFATDYDGTLRIAPAWPSGWDGSGTVYIQGGSKVDVQIESGTITTVAIQAGSTQTMSVRSPWSGKQVEVVNGSSGAVVVAPTTAATLSVPVTAGTSYLLEQTSSLTTSLPFAQVTGTQASAYKSLGGKVQIGLPGTATQVISLRAHANGDIVTADNTGTSPLIANRTAIGTWEEFDLINNSDGSVSLRAHANGDIVTADNTGTSPLIANRTTIGTWEEFDLIHD